MARYEAFARELESATGMNVGYRGGGTLEVALDDQHAQVLAARAAAGGEDQLLVRVLLAGVVGRAVRARVDRDDAPAEAQVDAPLLARALDLAAHAAGARFRTGQVHRIVHEGGRAAAVEHDAGRLDAGAVVLAAGAWSALVEGSGLRRGAVRPVRGQIVLLDTRPRLLSRVVFSDKGYVVPRADGRVLCGSTMEEVGFEKAVTAGGLRSVLSLAIEIAPQLANAPILDTWSNFRPSSPDGWPVLGASGIPGLFYATGHTRNGIMLTPITADAVSAVILGKPPPVDLAPFSVKRL